MDSSFDYLSASLLVKIDRSIEDEFMSSIVASGSGSPRRQTRNRSLRIRRPACSVDRGLGVDLVSCQTQIYLLWRATGRRAGEGSTPRSPLHQKHEKSKTYSMYGGKRQKEICTAWIDD